MAPDGSSGLHSAGEAIPNIDFVQKTIYAYYGDTGNGIANTLSSPYTSELAALEAKQTPRVVSACRQEVRQGKKPTVVLDADDTTLWTDDMEVNDMLFVVDPVRQDCWVQNKLFPATPWMPSLVAAVGWGPREHLGQATQSHLRPALSPQAARRRPAGRARTGQRRRATTAYNGSPQ